MSLVLDTLRLACAQDVVTARQRAREAARLLGFGDQDQARIATAVSEIARNAIRYAREGSLECRVEGEAPAQHLAIRIADRGPGIPNLQDILDGRHRSTTGMGLGIVGARRLMDQFEIASRRDGTVVTMRKAFEAGMAVATEAVVERVRGELHGLAAASAVDELQEQRRELLVALAEVREARDQLVRVNRELEDTNRGVVALYAELDEKAEDLRRADQSKSRFLSSMSHEFRTPLNSIRALSKLLLDRVDGPLSDEQARQVTLIRKATDDLSHLVEDLLDLARIEAGKLEIRPAEFQVDDLFAALRGMMRPLLVDDAVTLHFVPPAGVPPLFADEAKVSQVLRNFVSNALKFTERGSVTVSVEHRTDDDAVLFCVADTGIGIAPADRERIFDEFVQVRGPLQTRARGSGLGLPICRRLAQALGGEVYVESEVGAGSKFYFRLPVHRVPSADARPETPAVGSVGTWRIPILVVLDEGERRAFYEHILRETPYRADCVETEDEAHAALARAQPAAVLLDVRCGSEAASRWLGRLEAAPETQALPLLVVATTADDDARVAGAVACLHTPIERATLVSILDEATRGRILIVDDDATTRYTMRRLLRASGFPLLEATNGEDGRRAAELAHPRAIVLDLGLPDIDGRWLLEEFADSPATRGIPVIIATSRDLSDGERRQLKARAFAVLSKRELFDALAATVRAAIAEVPAFAETP